MNNPEKLIIEADYIDMITALTDENVQFLLVGGYAVGLHGYQRSTKDIDFWVLASQENSARLTKALEKFGAPMHDFSSTAFEKKGTNFQIGVAPIRIDIITEIAGVEFEDAYRNMKIMDIDGHKIPVISIPDLIKNKKNTGRKRDLNDAEHLDMILKNEKAGC
jgi:predicted nucleotidyltransferase